MLIKYLNVKRIHFSHLKFALPIFEAYAKYRTKRFEKNNRF